MLQVRNNAVLTAPLAIPATGAAVPFDTTVYSTNSSAALNGNAVQLLAPGAYSSVCEAVVQNEGTGAVTVSMQLYADGEPVTGAIVTETLEADAQASLCLPWFVTAVATATGTAAVSWRISGGAVSLVNAFAQVGGLYEGFA